MVKRGFDLILSGLGMLLLAPLIVAAAVLVRIDSPGPAIFRQERVGRGGRLFLIHKFRTMVLDAPARGGSITVGTDPRITRVGKWLRRTKFDELPQLYDVFRGEMSLVGPRPEVPHYVQYYPDSLRIKVLSVRPGITDNASIEFFDENAILARAVDPERAYIEVVLPRKLRIYEDYVDRQNLLLDVSIILRTLTRVFRSSARASTLNESQR